MHRIFFIALAAMVAGCMNQGAYESYYGKPQIVGRSEDTVQVRAGFNVSPTVTAEEACGGPAMLTKTEKTYQQGYYSIYYYRCA